MLGPKGFRIASRYLRTRLVFGRPARVMVKLEDKGDHHRPANMDMGGDASPTACLKHASDWWVKRVSDSFRSFSSKSTSVVVPAS
jgi:hypothetical protein